MKKRSVWNTIRIMVPIAWKAAPFRFLVINGLGILQSLQLGLNTILLAKLIDALQTAMYQKMMDENLMLAVCQYAIGAIAYQLMNATFNYLLGTYLDICDEKFRGIYNDRVSRLRPIDFEKSSILNEIQKAETGRQVAKVFIFHLIGIVDMVPPYVIFIGVYVTSLDPLLFGIIVAAFIPAVFMLGVNRHVYAHLEDTAAPINRKLKAYKESMIGKRFMKETLVLNGYSYFMDKFLQELSNLCKENVKTGRKATAIDSLVAGVNLCGYLFALITLIYCVMERTISISEFSAIYSSLAQFYGMITALVCGFVGETIRNIPAVENYASFVTKKPDVLPEGTFDKHQGIILDCVSFTYPGAEKAALQNITLTIPEQQHVAIVGENGAGKSTLAKLMIGLYEPDSGQVKIGGLHTAMIAENSFQRNISVVFQDFVRYQLTLSDNVKISDMNCDRDVCDVLLETQFNTELIHQRDKIMLSKEFGGIDLSGGQWQQVAIARAKYRDHTIVVLDEPTGAIDPMEERAVYKHFLEMSSEKTAIIISHRLGSARLAERILVVDHGTIVEDGSHEELLNKAGLYKKMWDAQSGNYVNG